MHLTCFSIFVDEIKFGYANGLASASSSVFVFVFNIFGYVTF